MADLRFGSVKIHPHERRLIVDGRDVPLGARALDVLVVLAERAGSLVSKNELLETVWPDTVVEENNLQVQVSTLRKVLGPHAIATIPGRGYRFTLTQTDDAPREKRALPPPAVEGPRTASTPLIDLYGRDDDLARVTSLVRSHELVTVVGSAGIGKTRLARAVAQTLAEAFSDGAQVIELAPLADPALVPMTVASVLGIAVGDARSALDVVVQALTEQRLLLVLDNCEHLLDSVDRTVAALRKGAVGVHILATSQEVLKHPDEHVHRLGPLAVPEQSTLQLARRAGAVELFMARTQAVDPRTVLSESNIGAVVEICRRLDGIPLAIELAAARVPLLGIDGVRARLDERFRLLMSGSRLALRRHQTLRAALEWSHGLLSQDEQQVFAKLGVFAGSFSLESAQQLAATQDMDEWVVLDHLGALVDKSLVVVEGVEHPRYRMLETTRAFALESLAEMGLTPRTTRRHAEVMLAAFERDPRDHLVGLSPQEAERLSADHDNLRSALRWACSEEGDAELAVALVGAAGAPMGYLRYVALRAEAWDFCQMVRPLVNPAMRAQKAAQFWLACAHHGGDLSPAVAIEDGERAVALYAELKDSAALYVALNYLAFPLLQVGRVSEAATRLQEALRLRDPAWPAPLRFRVDNFAALLYLAQDEVDKARRHATAYLLGAQQDGDFRQQRTAFAIVAEVAMMAGDVEGAAATAAEALAARPSADYVSSPSNRSGDGLSLRSFATALTLAGRLDEAEPVYREALTRAKRSFGTSAYVLIDMATYLAHRGDFANAARVRAYAAQAYAQSGRRPRGLAPRLDESLGAMLAEKLSPDELSRLYEEGRSLTDDAACAIVFPPPTSR
jgi:predicted ATPase/DNA-binding winged helix-turn-helix (wHTH) protein